MLRAARAGRYDLFKVSVARSRRTRAGAGPKATRRRAGWRSRHGSTLIFRPGLFAALADLRRPRAAGHAPRRGAVRETRRGRVPRGAGGPRGTSNIPRSRGAMASRCSRRLCAWPRRRAWTNNLSCGLIKSGTLLNSMHRKHGKSVTVLIDEYDSPITDVFVAHGGLQGE